MQLFDNSREGTRHFHRCLVAFECNQRRFGRHIVTGRDMDLDDFDVGEFANIRNPDFLALTHD